MFVTNHSHSFCGSRCNQIRVSNLCESISCSFCKRLRECPILQFLELCHYICIQGNETRLWRGISQPCDKLIIAMLYFLFYLDAYEHLSPLIISVILCQKVGHRSNGISFFERMNILLSNKYAIILDVIVHKMLESITIQSRKSISFSITKLSIVHSIPHMDSKCSSNTFNTGKIEVSAFRGFFCFWSMTVF